MKTKTILLAGWMVKIPMILLVMLLALYPVAELTRVIFTWRATYPELVDADTTGELVIMWVLYLLIFPVMWKPLDRK